MANPTKNCYQFGNVSNKNAEQSVSSTPESVKEPEIIGHELEIRCRREQRWNTIPYPVGKKHTNRPFQSQTPTAQKQRNRPSTSKLPLKKLQERLISSMQIPWWPKNKIMCGGSKKQCRTTYGGVAMSHRQRHTNLLTAHEMNPHFADPQEHTGMGNFRKCKIWWKYSKRFQNGEPGCLVVTKWGKRGEGNGLAHKIASLLRFSTISVRYKRLGLGLCTLSFSQPDGWVWGISMTCPLNSQLVFGMLNMKAHRRAACSVVGSCSMVETNKSSAIFIKWCIIHATYRMLSFGVAPQSSYRQPTDIRWRSK